MLYAQIPQISFSSKYFVNQVSLAHITTIQVNRNDNCKKFDEKDELTNVNENKQAIAVCVRFKL